MNYYYYLLLLSVLLLAPSFTVMCSNGTMCYTTLVDDYFLGLYCAVHVNLFTLKYMQFTYLW